MIDKLREYIAWYCMTFIGVISLLSIIPLGLHGESAIELTFPAMWWVLTIVIALVNLIHLIKPPYDGNIMAKRRSESSGRSQ